jgi:hypothetical protein
VQSTITERSETFSIVAPHCVQVIARIYSN